MVQTFTDFVTTAKTKATEVNSAPRQVQSAQTGIDAANRAGLANENTVFNDIEALMEGRTTARSARKADLEDLCAAIVPPNTVADSSRPSVAVSLTPGNWNDGSNQATLPNVQAIPTFVSEGYQTVAQVSIGRTRLCIQNVGATGNLFVVFGKATQFDSNITDRYHVRIVPGQTYFDDQWQGRIDVASDTGAIISVTELSRAQNVSQ